MKIVHPSLYPEVIRETKRIIPDIEINALLSLPYIDGTAADMVQLRQEGLLAFLMTDTGTFGHNAVSNKPQQKSEFDAYCLWNLLFGDGFDVIPSFDEDFHDPSLNQTLLERMRLRLESGYGGAAARPDLVSRLMPVVHSTDKAFDEFRYYHERGFAYIAIGSKPEPSPDEVQKIQEYRYKHGIKVHRFGKCGVKEISAFAPDSVDHSNYALSVFYDKALMLYWKADGPGTPEMVTVTYRGVNVPTAVVYDDAIHGEYLRRAGFEFGYDGLLADISKRHMVNLYSYWLMQKWMTEVRCPQHRAQFISAA